jgi:hypothetical protein
MSKLKRKQVIDLEITPVVKEYQQHHLIYSNCKRRIPNQSYRCHCKQWNEGHSESEIVAMLREQVEGKAKYFDEVEPQKSGVAESEQWGNLGIVYKKENISFDDIFKQPEYPNGVREYKGPGKLKSILN